VDHGKSLFFLGLIRVAPGVVLGAGALFFFWHKNRLEYRVERMDGRMKRRRGERFEAQAGVG
jgi:hypothetical protein